MQTMKNRILLLVFLLGVAVTTSAQAAAPQEPETSQCPQGRKAGHHKKNEGRKFDPKDYQQKMEIYITAQAGLTDREAEVFFPIFRQSKQQQRELSKKVGKKLRDSEDQTLTDKQCEAVLSELQDLRLEEARLQDQTIKKWCKCLPASKVLKVMKAEAEYSRKTFREMTRTPGR